MHMVLYHFMYFVTIIYTTLVWVCKGAAQDLTHIFTGQYLDITQAILRECGLLMALMPNQFKDMKRFDLFY